MFARPSLATAAAPAAPAPATRPNVILIMTDDQARWALGCYGNKECPTPHMDRIAAEGARFTNAFVATPVCSPSRAGFFTGRYGTELGITDWLNKNEMDSGLGLPDVPTWPGELRRAGYETALIGKWHLGDQPQFHPTKHGFTRFTGFLGGGQFPMDPQLEVDGKLQQMKGPISDLLGDAALKFLDGAAKDRPFAMCLFFREPHQPYQPMPRQDNAVVEDLDPTIPSNPHIDPRHVKKLTRDYYAAVHAADRNIGRVLAKLDELRIADNTVVIFTSDHGYCIGQHTLHTKGNASWIAGGVEGPKRPNMFEESIRIPLLIRWPAVTKPGSVIDPVVSNIDFFASILGMTGVAVPADSKQHGVDFSPLLRGQSIPPRDALFGQYDLHNGGFASMRMIRTSRYKLVRHQLTNGLNELYDLQRDPGETKNLYNSPEAKSARDDLQKQLTAWQQSINDPTLTNPLNTKAVGGPLDVR
jgi:uncharacterized sulfatase